MTSDIEVLRLRYPWLGVHISSTEYLGPDYYQKLLRPYVFGGRTDLQILREWLEDGSLTSRIPALEIGPGPGRATSVFLSARQTQSLQLVDLSNQMLSYCRRRFVDEKRLLYMQKDAVEFLRECETSFSLGFSLWSLSHSIHRAIQDRGELEGEKVSREAIRALFTSVLEPGGRFLLIHFDPSSQEQRISLRQRSKLQPFLTSKTEVPSRLIIDSVCADLQQRGLIQVDIEHLSGEPIRYAGMDDALEIFMNLHMEGMFNEHRLLPGVIRELTEDLARYQDESGRITIETGCYLYRCTVERRSRA